MYWTLTKHFQHDPDHVDKEKNLFEKLWDKYGRDRVRTFRAYADFQKVERTSLTSLQKKRIQVRHVYSNGKDADGRKNSSDIELCIDAIESTFKDEKITCYVFVTADSDMIPIMSRLMYKGKRVELFYLAQAAPKHVDISSFAHEAFDLVEFLNVEVKEYNIEELVIPALQHIEQWNVKFRTNTRRWLGNPVLRSDLSKQLGVPEETCSELIEMLRTKEMIADENKITDSGTKKSVVLTPIGQEYSKATVKQEVAATAASEEQSNS